MARNRTGLAPWSLAREAGIESATVDGRIEVPQYVQPTLNTGFVDEKGDWKGAKSNDKVFIAFEVHESIPNGGELLAPNVNADGTWPLDMTGYNDLLLAIKTTAGGNYKIEGIMGPADVSYANLNPVDAAAVLRYLPNVDRESFMNCVNDAAEALTVNVWNIYMLQGRLANQKLPQFKITNNTGGAASTIETAFMRLV